ncbi:MAG: type II toxin-antitoxin system VapC family toxin [Terracidiphilus sp.]
MTGARVLFDTTVLIDLLHRRAEATALLRQLAGRGADLLISTVTVGEIYAGIRAGEQALTASLLGSFSAIPLSEEIAKRAGELVSSRRLAGRTHSLDDMMIAATALEFGCELATSNRRDFEVPGIVFLKMRGGS